MALNKGRLLLGRNDMAGPVGFEPTILGSEGPRLGPGSTTGPGNCENVYAS
jgi:hypothetical protein